MAAGGGRQGSVCVPLQVVSGQYDKCALAPLNKQTCRPRCSAPVPRLGCGQPSAGVYTVHWAAQEGMLASTRQEEMEITRVDSAMAPPQASIQPRGAGMQRTQTHTHGHTHAHTHTHGHTRTHTDTHTHTDRRSPAGICGYGGEHIS